MEQDVFQFDDQFRDDFVSNLFKGNAADCFHAASEDERNLH